MNPTSWRSKALADSGLIRVMEFAIRGMPAIFLPSELAIDRDRAAAIYGGELQDMDRLQLSSRFFWSGALGAGIIGLCLWPQTIELWRQAGQRKVLRDEFGLNGPGVLHQLVLRFQNERRLTRLPEFQWFVFQTTLGLCEAWAFSDSDQVRFPVWPRIENAWSLLERVRKHKGQPFDETLFAPPEIIRSHWRRIPAPAYLHEEGMSVGRRLAEWVLSAEVSASGRPDLDAACSRLIGLSISPSLSHPALIGAALITITEYPSSFALWRRIFSEKGVRRPCGKRGFVNDAAQVIQDCVAVASRGRHPTLDTLLVLRRARFVVAHWVSNPDRLWSALPRVRVPEQKELDRLDQLRLNLAPTLDFARIERLRVLKAPGGN